MRWAYTVHVHEVGLTLYMYMRWAYTVHVHEVGLTLYMYMRWAYTVHVHEWGLRTVVCTTRMDINVHGLMRDEKEGRNKQARSNKQQGKATQHTQGSLRVHVH